MTGRSVQVFRTARLLRSVNRHGPITGESLSPKAILALQPVPVLFGVPVRTGAVVWTIPNAVADDPEAAFERISKAAIGESFDVKLMLSAPVEVRAMGIHSGSS